MSYASVTHVSCRLDEVRAFIEGGWSCCANPEGDLTAKGPLFELDVEDFQKNCLPHLEENDCVIVLSLQSTFALSERRCEREREREGRGEREGGGR
jgi:hypothetical protein